MDDEHTKDYREPCVQCSAVDWGLTEEGQFYCRSCHNVIERTQEFVDSSYITNSQATTISRRLKTKKLEHGREWMVCEGFQFILKHQAEALLALGVCPQFKDEVLWNMWRKYLQNSRQAYTKRPVHAGKFQLACDSDSAPESLALLSDSTLQSGSEAEGEMGSRPGSVSGWSSDDGASSVCSGSLDAGFYSSARSRKSLCLMSMPMTLAFCHLALLWVREALTLADLLRFVAEGHVPYVNAYQVFPEEMKPYGRDIRVFRVESIPTHQKVWKEAHRLAVFLGLPQFPPMTPDCLLHPSPLCLRYLMEANLPDELHDWVSKVIDQTGIGAEDFLTYDPTAQSALLHSYDVQAASLIVVTLKLLFKLDDKVEWTLCKKVDDNSQGNQGDRSFSLRTWYKTVHHALDLAREREEQDQARRSWKPSKSLYPSKEHKSVVLKRRRVVEELQANFQRLCGSGPRPRAPSSFRFQWGGEGADGPSFRHLSLDHVTQGGQGSPRLSNPRYWHTALRTCKPSRCTDHFSEAQPTLPRTYVWVLGLFSFLLGVKSAQLHAGVCSVESRLLRGTTPPARLARGKKRLAQTYE